tara:strand:- start:9085 stop:9816 length:732 start_codon:yes stop_codon:yes gene_type:complete
MILNDSLGWGRLCNQIFRSIAISMLAQKHNLKVEQYPLKYIDIIHKLGIILFSGTNNYSHTKKLNDDNYLSYLSTENINHSFSIDYCFFQTKEISDLIFNYINTTCKDNIIKCNKFKERYNNNNDIFIHIRLGDTIQWRIETKYYINIINTINYDNIYISSDTLNDKEIMKIKNMFKNVHLIDYNEIDTLHFGSTCKNLILSNGSFSAIIGYMAFYSNVYYYKNTSNWCPLSIFIDKNFIASI